MRLQQEWQLQELHKSEEEMSHDPMGEEYLFYNAVRSGNLEYVEENCRKGSFRELGGKGILSRNPLTNIRYHFVVTAAMVTRHCVIAGLVQEQAYRLSDFYIQKMDECETIDAICKLHDQMVLDLTRRMKDYQNSIMISQMVRKGIDYIYANIHHRITVDEMAENLQVSASHLSRQFKKEMKVSISDYIRSKKVERAKNLLRYSEFSYVDIANYLAFSSQSHFIQTFEKQVGQTPKQYREQFYRTSWKIDKQSTQEMKTEQSYGTED